MTISKFGFIDNKLENDYTSKHSPARVSINHANRSSVSLS